MARRKTTAKKTSAPEVEKTVEFSYDRRVTVSVGTAANYGQAKVGLSLSENVKADDDPMEVIDSIFDDLTEKLEKKFDILAQEVGLDDEEEEETDEDQEESKEEDEEWEDEDEDEESDSDGEDEDEDEDEEDGDEDEDLTEEEILKMKKAELLELIDEEELDVDPKGMKIKELREAVVDAYFEEDEEDEDEDSDSDDADGDDEEWEDEDWEDEEDDED